jgi:hypothetical protein
MYIEPQTWSSDARLASQVWFGISAANRWHVINTHGEPAALGLEFDFMRRHQEAHFLDGAEKLGILDQPHPALCAQYHALSNQIGGLDMGYTDEGDGRAWVYYLPPQGLAGSPLLPSPGVAAASAEFMIANMEAWHANNGVVLGNPRLRFVVTDLVCAGGPWDAGYFEEAAQPLDERGRLERRLDVRTPDPGAPPPLNADEWPQERRDVALKKYSAEYATVGLAEVARRFGIDAAAQVAEMSFRSVFLSWARHLVDEFQIPDDQATSRTVALFRRCFELLGDEFTAEDDNGNVVLRHEKTRLTLPQYGWKTPPRQIEDAIAGAWTTVSRVVGEEVVVSVESSSSEGEGETVWRFSPWSG